MNAALLTTVFCIFKMILPSCINLILLHIYKESKTELTLRIKDRDMKRTLNGLSIVDEFAKYAKLQRQLNKVQQDLSDASSQRVAQYTKIRLSVIYTVRVLYALVILAIIWIYKSTPIVVLPVHWTVPFGSVMRWPTEVEGGISISMWIVMLETSLKTVSSKLFPAT